MSNNPFDVIIIGGGPGGYVAAIRAAQLGMRVALVEAEHLGGICLNWGCIPTKSLLRSSEVYNLLENPEPFGVKVEKISFDFEKMIARSRAVSEQLSKGIQHLLKKNKVDVFKGHGQLQGREKEFHKIEVHSGSQKQTLLAKKVILATGARARSLPGLEPDGKDIWTYREAMTPKSKPERLLVIGSGAIGIEFASFYRSLGSQVTVVELVERILPAEDLEISTFAQKAFEKKGIQIFTQTQVDNLEKTSKGLKVRLKTPKGPQEMLVDKVILAVGIVGNVENLGLEKTKAKVEKTHIVVNEWCETQEEGIYAIGDVAGPPWLAHKASHEGTMVVERIAGLSHLHPLKRENVPGCTYSMPQVASVGLTEKQAQEKGYAVKVGRFPFMGNGKAIALGEPEGFVKTLFDAKTGELLGAHMIGAEVTEMIQGFAIAKTAELTEADLMQTIFPHPTLSEMMHESVLDAFGRVIHI